MVHAKLKAQPPQQYLRVAANAVRIMQSCHQSGATRAIGCWPYLLMVDQLILRRIVCVADEQLCGQLACWMINPLETTRRRVAILRCRSRASNPGAICNRNRHSTLTPRHIS